MKYACAVTSRCYKVNIYLGGKKYDTACFCFFFGRKRRKNTSNLFEIRISIEIFPKTM